MKELDPRIRIRAPLRCDGIGRLDCAEDTVSGDRLAVRWLPLDANGDAAVKACEKLPSHPTLPRIHQTGQVGSSAFVALDFPDGEMLSARGEEAMENEALLQLAAQLSDALSTVHAQGVVHGEMSRDSVLLVPGGKAILWDLPLVIASRLSDRRGENRLMQNLVKTAPYLAPERARGEGASQAGDVYALGALLCVAGGAPLPTASTTLGVVHLVGSGAWKPRVPESLSVHWSRMLERMISAEPSARPTAAEVALTFAHVPGQAALPTVPELPAMKLPPEILAAADALMREQLEAMRAPTREVPAVQLEAAAAEAAVAQAPAAAPAAEAAVAQAPVAAPAAEALPVAVDPLPDLSAPQRTVQANTLDEVHEPAPDVVRIPTIELKALTAEAPTPAPVVEAAPVVVAPAPTSVALNDSLAVAPELLPGTVTHSAEEMEALRANALRAWMVFGGLAGAALALITVVVVLATRSPAVEPQPLPVPTPVKAAPAAPRPVPEELELEPIPKLKAKAAAPRAVTRATPAPAPVEAAAAEPAPEPSVAPTAPTAEARPDFSFLEGAEAPKSELKRPSSEL